MDSFYQKTEFTEEDINRIVSEKMEESLNLEFKSSGALSKQDLAKKEISKDISSFANSDGGLIVYGIVEANHVATSVDYIDGDEFNKEWLENVIDSNIQRRIPGIEIYPVRISEDFKKSLYVVKVPSSNLSPHMAKDGRYYKRFNFKAAPMEEYEVRLLLNRKFSTELRLAEVLLNPGSSSSVKDTSTHKSRFNYLNFELTFQVVNTGMAIENQYKLELYIPSNLLNSATNLNTHLLRYLIREEEEFVVYSIPNDSPLFQQETTTVTSINITLTRGNLKLCDAPGIRLRLFYTNGLDKQRLSFSQGLIYKSNILTTEDFI